MSAGSSMYTDGCSVYIELLQASIFLEECGGEEKTVISCNNQQIDLAGGFIFFSWTVRK